MTRRFHPLVPAIECTGRAQPGTAALQLAVLDMFPGTFDWGIYNCRPVRGGTTLSHHAEGRAGDKGIPLVNGRANTKVGDPIVQALLNNAWELGLDHLIWNGVYYSDRYPNGRHYSGSTPTLRHEDHIHDGQAWWAARSLTETECKAILVGDMAHPPESIRDWRNNHSIPAVPDWAGWDEYVAKSGTHEPSGVWPAGRADLAWFFHSFIEPLQAEVSAQAEEIRLLRAQGAQSGSHSHPEYVRRGQSYTIG